MRREKRNNKVEDKIRWGKLVSFIIAIILLIIAISASMSQEKVVGNLSYDRNLVEQNTLESASSDLSKSVNQILIQNNIGGDNQEESDEELNEIQSSLITNQTENNATDNKEVSANVTDSNQKTTNTTNSNENTLNKNNVNAENQTNNEQIENKVEENNTDEKATTQFVFPVEGEVIKEFAKDNLIYSETLEEWITHPGIDIKADRTTIVKVVAEGTVKSIKNDPRYGLTVTIEHADGYTSVYSSLLTAEFVKEGEKVTQGQTIGTVGNSAVFEVAEDNHLHFELLKDGSNINPEIYLK